MTGWLNEQVLSSSWFFYLSAFVAFNTLVFVGLSFGKILYWPQQMSSRTVEKLRNDAERLDDQ